MSRAEPATLAGVPLTRYPHACAIVSSRDEERGVIAPFVAEALDRGEQAFFIHAPERRDEVRGWIAGEGCDAEAAEATGQLRLLDWSEAYLRNGRFDVEKMLELVGDVAGGSRTAGYPRSRLVGHMDWTAGNRAGVGDAIEYEARVNSVLAENGTPAVCVYPVDLVKPRMLVDLLAVHPVVFMGGAAQVSPFFVPPDEFLRSQRGRRAQA